MRVERAPEAIRPFLRAPVATIGNFDGLHRGHRAILDRVLERARATGGTSLVITFEPHPLAVLAPDRAPRMIVTRRQKLALLEAAGIDAVLVMTFDAALAAVGAADFVAGHLSARLGVREAYVGANFNFGRGREGDADTLVRLCDAHGIIAARVDEVRFLGSPVSSSRIRRAIAAGEVELARELLGRPFALEGTVTHGAGRGAALGIPTANLDVANDLVPQDGVYVTEARLDGRGLPSVTNIGTRPTFRDQRFTVETHLLDTAPDLYGRPIEIAFLARLRQELRFDSPQALVEQIRRDIERARAYFSERGPSGAAC
jgi:riboflavin kinase/FMN adenylyltransferase